MKKNNILVTGAAGFIGFHMCNHLFKKKNYDIVAVDNFDPYYDTKLKNNRKDNLNKKIKFINLDLKNLRSLELLFKKYNFRTVVHLAAQPGVRYSIENPRAYFENNLSVFFNLIDLSKKFKINHFIYASSSSVYGNLKKFPLKEFYETNNPISFYATTKKCNEMIAESYSKNFNLKCTGLRFFTVYGPFGRPDMSLFKFVNSIFKKQKVEIFNNGNHVRDFTYIDDVTNAVYKILIKKNNKKKHVIYNIAGGKPKTLDNYIHQIENILGKKLKRKNTNLQKGDVLKTHADITKLIKDFNFQPKVGLKQGLTKYIKWFQNYYKKY